MPLPPHNHEDSSSTPRPEQPLAGPEIDSPALFLRDAQLLRELAERNEHPRHPSEDTGLQFANSELTNRARATYDAQDLAELETLLNQEGTLRIPVSGGHTVLVDGTPREVTIVPATEINADGAHHGDMSSMLYLRDQVQAASALMELSLRAPLDYIQEGESARTLLVSALHLMSTPAQLARFEHVIEEGGEAGQEEWPHISLRFDDLEGENPNGWRNKQDSFQMLAYASLDALERGFLNFDELADGHKQFLGAVVPFLESVGYPKYENSGSWEEVAANRTSVMAVETALLHKIKTLAEKDPAFEFLLARSGRETLDAMLSEGLTEIGQRLPFESPDHDPASVKYREADASLAYVLMYDIPDLLAEARTPIGPAADVMSPQEIENLVLQQLYTLIDPVTNGMVRYRGDSYQRVNFHTNQVQATISDIKRQVKAETAQTGGEVDLERKQALRGELTPPGKEAAWSHPLGQLSAWAAERALREDDPAQAAAYRELSTQFLNRALSMVTGESQWNAALGADGFYRAQPVTPYRSPECYVAYQTDAGEQFDVPSPHTPLNWSSATIKKSIGLLKMATAAQADLAKTP